MYEGFPSRADENRMQAFHAAGWAEGAEIAETIEDDRYRELARRIVFHEQSDALQPERRQLLEVWLQHRLQGREGVKAGRTLSDALSDFDGITVNGTNASALQEIRRWLQRRGGRVASKVSDATLADFDRLPRLAPPACDGRHNKPGIPAKPVGPALPTPPV
jgi:hypothetical protein